MLKDNQGLCPESLAKKQTKKLLAYLTPVDGFRDQIGSLANSRNETTFEPS